MKITFSFFLLFITSTFAGQSIKKITLNDAFKMAKEKSADGIRYENKYFSSQLEFQSFKNEILPAVKVDLFPFTYNKQVVQRYNSLTNRDEYKKQQTLNVYGEINIEQKVPLTGGLIYVQSNLGRLTGYGYNKYTTFSSTFGRIGFNQPIFGFNAFKWKKKIEPLRFRKSRKEFIASEQEINIKTVGLFFDLLYAEQQLATAVLNAKNAKQLYEIGIKRFEIAGIEKDELLQLELNNINASIEIQKIRKMKSSANAALNTYLGNAEDIILEALPDNLNTLPEFKISFNTALELVKNNNPEVQGYAQQILEAEQRLAAVKGEGGLKMNLAMSLGLDQQAEEFKALYQLPPLDQQRVEIGISVPILDWGMHNRNLQRVRKDLEAIKATVKENQQELEQKIRNLIENFNLQEEVVESASKANLIAEQNLLLTSERFKLAKTNVIALNAAISARMSAQRNFIEGVRNYWEYYYLIQKMTGYDFIKSQNLTEND